jgi:hypothetical protein
VVSTWRKKTRLLYYWFQGPALVHGVERDKVSHTADLRAITERKYLKRPEIQARSSCCQAHSLAKLELIKIWRCRRENTMNKLKSGEKYNLTLWVCSATWHSIVSINAMKLHFLYYHDYVAVVCERLLNMEGGRKPADATEFVKASGSS